MRVRPILSLGIALSVAAAASPALAVRPPQHRQHIPRFEVAEGGQSLARRAPQKPVYDRVPDAAVPAWSAFLTSAGGEWTALWDPDTGVPSRIFGSGIAAPGAVRSADKAEAHARAALRAYLPLLAPGAQVDDFELEANHLDAFGLRTVSFLQHHAGVRVLGGQVSFRFKEGRLFVIASEALPNVRVAQTFATVSRGVARERARGWVDRDFGAGATASSPGGPYILPIVRGPGTIEYRTVKSVEVDAPSMPARWDVYVDGVTGDPVARRQTLMFASGHIRFNTPVRRPGGERQAFPASFLGINAEGLDATADYDGRFAWGVGDTDISATVEGPFVVVSNEAGGEVTISDTYLDGDDKTYNASDNELQDAQLTAFVHANRAKEYVRQYNPSLEWLDQQMPVVVNLPDFQDRAGCNAFSDGNQINFLTEANGCNNTARTVDVVYHEFGHSIHRQSIISGAGAFDSSVSEGVSDYLAATITDDAGMGRGFFLNDPSSPLRDVEEDRFFSDLQEQCSRNGSIEEHCAGRVIASTLWDLRKAMIEKHGPVVGRTRTDRLWYAILQRASDMRSAYAEVIAADDDDGDLLNGTPNSCLINQAFEKHGLGDGSADVVAGVQTPTRDGYQVSLSIEQPDASCDPIPVGVARIHWQRRGDPDTGGTVQMERSAGGLSGALPEQPDEVVLEYQVEVVLDNGGTFVYPRNPADPYYEHYVGEVEQVWCEDFESDPFASGDWTSGSDTGTDEWEWGELSGEGNGGDPLAAHSGQSVLGVDLGAGGREALYPNETVNWVESPEIDVSEVDSPRLQLWRALNIEDGFYDQARIYVDGEVVWENFASESQDGANQHHRDREWRFQDIDLSRHADDGTVQVRFEYESDGGLAFGGWNLDDTCVVAYKPPPMCGNGEEEEGEDCDDGNRENGDGCSEQCTAEVPNDGGGGGGVNSPDGTPRKPGCSCEIGERGGAPAGTGASLLALGLIAGAGALRRRRR